MLTFFRRIRKSLLASGAVRKYILYAAGEVLLVMIGILLALQVNNWNEWRKDRIKEHEVLIEIRKTLDNNVEQMRQALKQFEETDESSTLIINFIQNKLPYNDSLSRHFYKATWTGAKWEGVISNAGYEIFKNEGFDIVNNDSLRGAIVHHFENSIPILLNNFRSRDENLTNHLEHLERNFMVTQDMTGYLPYNYQDLRRDEYYFSYITKIKESKRQLTIIVNNHIEKCDETLQLIKDELGEE